ncbi:hypothetical protein ABB37_01981 [Leptomonas pyrrhocoris]|uniref:Uncharacterized protein n=1 Tax=Leptomonas pyrrhocoris TaxID=157538 RepID=A0A0N0VGV3_LEPPY|nr:hypothetical protein ABB37_01981 [Leptomonas pyrrhocoris]XP_015662178.1 hypothetical protein ABB37_01981 [Leptomonas pyrrhocoris]KPA83738.1 hypothetical protein ABB37_01981 [Leptomonas pyrrhocoris]KPA83739.1 hypothetical protein ABB37_01981 [Leptomonas pyrrhocoris]|eukprot:XP_015662177.1 hypothetical protein ABB37_01981 [Leptomonas pyrrhocoris]
MSDVTAQIQLSPLREVPLSPVEREETSAEPSFSCHCVVEDMRGWPAAAPFSLSVSPERTTIPQSPSQDVHPGSCTNPSPHGLSSPDQADVVNGTDTAATSAGAAGINGAASDALAAAAATHQGSGSASYSRNGDTVALASSVSGSHVTQDGMVVPPIQGIPQSKGTATSAPAPHAKVNWKDRKVPPRTKLAVKGAFSNMTTVDVLRQVRPLQTKTRQVEAAGWSKLGYDELEEEEEAPHAYAAPPSPQQEERGAKRDDSDGADDDRDDWDRRVEAEEAATRVHTEAPPRHQRVSPEGVGAGGSSVSRTPPQDSAMKRPNDRVPLVHTPRNTASVQAACPSPSAALPGGVVHEVEPYATRTAASAQRSPTVLRSPPSHLLSSYRDVYSTYGVAAPDHYSGGSRRVAAAPPAAVVTTAIHEKPTHDNADATHPVGFALCAAIGQQRRAAAERAYLERAAEAAGEPHPLANKNRPTSAGDVRGARRPRKMSLLPPPRGYEAFAQKGHARRTAAEQEEEQRQRDEVRNCTYVPRINQRRSPSAVNTGTASRKASQTSTNVFDGGKAAATSPSPQSSAPGDSSESNASVFERLVKEAAQRDARLRQLELKYTPSFVPQRITAAAAPVVEEGSAAAPPAPPHGHSRNVFEELYALSKKRTPSPSPAKTADVERKGHSARAASAHPGCAETARTHPKEGEASSEAVDAGATADGAAVHVKKSEAEIAQYIAGMLSREAERRTRWTKHQLALKAEDERASLRHPALNPKTGELAERARARHRAREEQQKLQEAEKVKRHEAKKVAIGRPAQRRQREERSRHPQKPQQPHQTSAATKGTTTSAEVSNVATEPARAVAAASPSTPARRSLGAEFYEHQQRTEERKCRHLEQLRLQKAEEEFKECTFRPRINNVSEKIAQRVLVESFDVAEDDAARRRDFPQFTTPPDAPMLRQGSLPRSVDLACHDGRSLLHELRGETPPQDPIVRAPSCAADSEEGEFALRVQRIPLEAARAGPSADDITPQRSPEPLSAQLRNLEEMLREWKELERECSPMLRRPSQTGVAD